MPTVQILLRNNKDTIEKALHSVSGLGRVVVGDLGSEDGSLEICSSYGVEVVDLKGCVDFSLARNQLSDDGVNFYIEAWEYLARGSDEISSSTSPKKAYVLQNGLVSKETRIWVGKGLFKNPVYETIVAEAKCDPSIVILSGKSPDLREERRVLARKWMEERPTSSEPYYYMACMALSDRNYKDFFFYANKYLAMEQNHGEESVLLYYYMAQIELHTGKIQEASKKITFCLTFCPTMAEFWCLLGDLFYRQKKFGKARSMYENALLIGGRRKSSDSYPIEISKYKEYPEKMMINIDEISADIADRIKKATEKQ